MAILRFCTLLSFLASVCNGDDVILRRFIPEPRLDPGRLKNLRESPASFAASAPDMESRIINGQDCFHCEFPYQILIEIKTPKGSAICGGALIAAQYAITAAHCVNGPMTIKFGTTERVPKGENNATYDVMSIDPDDITIHPDYSDPDIRNDLAVVKLPRRPKRNDCIKAVRLPSRSMAAVNSYEGADALITGWGQISDKYKKPSTVLQVATVSVMNHQKCVDMYKKLQYNIRETQICSGFLGSGTCSGDSGGPMVIKESDGSDILTLFGTVSFGTTLCTSGYPSVYTKIARYLDWISSITGIPIRD